LLAELFKAEKQYDPATDSYSKALSLAPEAKKAAIRSLPRADACAEKSARFPLQHLLPNGTTTLAEVVL